MARCTESGVKCGGCDRVLDESPSLPVEDRTPCPGCGSTLRVMTAHLAAGMAVTSMLRLKARTSGQGKAFAEGKSGQDWSHRLKRWVRLNRLIDRRNDRYRETVTDPVNGAIIHSMDEPLSDHIGHGSAKKRTER
jgi:hypothetical protein